MPFDVQPAMRPVRSGRGTPTSRSTRLEQLALLAVGVDTDAKARPVTGVDRIRRVTHEALGLLPPASAQYGSAARTSPLRRIRSAVLLGVLLVVLGVVVALSLGVVAFLAGFLLEQAIK